MGSPSGAIVSCCVSSSSSQDPRKHPMLMGVLCLTSSSLPSIQPIPCWLTWKLLVIRQFGSTQTSMLMAK